MTTRVIEGSLVVPKGARFGIVASRFNHFVVDRLVEGVERRLAGSEKLDAVIALGAVIRGATPHFDYVASEAAGGLSTAAQASAVPIIFGVLTTDTIEQAIERAGTKSGNKGWDAAVTAVEMVALGRALDDAGL